VSLAKGARLGPYEIIGLLGAGGMGEVYRARDARLGREVAIKTLPDDVSGSTELVRRFEREARAASALNHPNIVTIFDAGWEGDVAYLAMELVDGTNLRHLLDGQPMPSRRLLPIAMQIADGLAAAHERGIVHRDLKPENVMVDRQGRAKILDFGLAKDISPAIADEASPTLTLEERTREGTILGTAGYMSPEQASGRSADFHTDQFSFGAILYEMASGARAFHGATAVETLSSVIRDEPPPLLERVPGTPAPLTWIVERCLAKEPGERYGSTRDLARDLATLREHVSRIGPAPGSPGAVPPRRPRGRLRGAAIAAALLAAIVAALFFGARRGGPPAPEFEQLTFRRGTVLNARFAPGGDTIVYGAAWEGKPFEVFSTRGSAGGSRSLGLTSADVLAVSRGGEMLVSVRRRALGGFFYLGTLARADLSGGAPREMLDGVSEADWAPDGKELAICRPAGEGLELDFPLGHSIFTTNGWISQPKVSPRGDAVAFIHHPLPGDDRGEIDVVDRQGKRRVLSTGWTSAQGLAWRPDGKEVWFTATGSGTNRSLNAVDLSGAVRVVHRSADSLLLQDISPAGRVLVTRTDLPVTLMVAPSGSSGERSVAWLDASILRDISFDGKTVVFTEAGQGGGPNCSVFVRRVDEPEAVRLGEGWAGGLSPDGRSVLAILPGAKDGLLVYPVGAGATRTVVHAGVRDEQWAAWLPDGNRVVFAGREAGHGVRIFVQEISGESPKPITPEGVAVRQIESAAASVTPDGRWVAVGSPEGVMTLYPVEGGMARPIPAVAPGEYVVGWSRDGSAAFVSRQAVPAPVFRVDLERGTRSPFRQLAPSDAAGVSAVSPVVLAPDGAAYAYSCLIYMSQLYVADGLR
jgi:Tol biopolymer transport system component